jgi:short-subunit dehydrogenase
VETGFGDTAGFDPKDSHDALPSIMWLSSRDVARAAVDGLDRRRVVVIPGAANWAGARLAWLTPRRLLVPLLARNHPGLKR